MNDTDTQDTEQTDVSTETQGEAIAESDLNQVPDLDKLEKFRFGGMELTPAELKNSYMRHADYTKKTQALSEERKYYDNLSADLNAVKANPALAEEFRKIYPEKFHAYLGYVTPEEKKAIEQNASASLPKEIMDKINNFEAIANKLTAAEQAANQQRVDSAIDKLNEKYPYAVEDTVINQALKAVEQGQKVDDALLEKLYKANNDVMLKRFEGHYSKKVTTQVQAGSKARDVAPGGGTSTDAPVRPRSIREAARMAEERLVSSQGF